MKHVSRKLNASIASGSGSTNFAWNKNAISASVSSMNSNIVERQQRRNVQPGGRSF